MNLSKLRRMVADGDMSVEAFRYLLECRGECEHLDFKEELHLNIDHECANFARDVVAMKNVGGGYILIGVQDKTWKPVGLKQPNIMDTKLLREKVRKATGLEIDVDIVSNKLLIGNIQFEFALIWVRSTSKQSKLKTPSICKIDFCSKENWGIRRGEIYIRKGDQTVKLSSEEELAKLLENLEENYSLSSIVQITSPFEIETGLYRLLPREYGTFIGRIDLKELAIEAIEKDPRIWIVNLYGPGGVGKSALANWLAHYYYEQKTFEAILQLSAKDTQLTARGISKLSPSLYSLENLLDSILLLFQHEEYIEKSLDDRKKSVIELLSVFSTLLILDNMETVDDGRVMQFVQALPPSSKAKVLLTSRSRSGGWEMAVPVNELNLEEVKEFTQYKIKEMGVSLPGDFETIVEKIHIASGGLPLAIHWLLGRYALTHNLNLVINEVRDEDSPLLEFSFRKSWADLDGDSQKALAILSICDEPPTLHLWATALAWSAEKVEKASSSLIYSTFVSKIVDTKSGQETYNALPITLAFARNQLGKMGSLEITARTRYQHHIQEMQLVAIETEPFKELFERFQVERDTEKRAIILARKAEAKATSLDDEEAQRLYQNALELDKRSVYVLVSYGLFKADIGQVGDAVKLIEDAAIRCNKNTGFFVYSSLSKIYDKVRNYTKIEQSLRQALSYYPKHPISRHRLGIVLSKQGKYNEAIEVFDTLIKEELNRNTGPSDTLIIAYKSKIISLMKNSRSIEAKSVLSQAQSEISKWSYLSSKVYELEDLLN